MNELLPYLTTAQNMLDFDYCCKRPTPSVAGMIYPFGGDSVQKFYWGTSEILLPVYKVITCMFV